MSALQGADLSVADLPEALGALAGCTVTRLVIDDALSLRLQGAGRAATLRIDGAGRFEQGGAAHRFDPDADPAGLAPLLALLQARVARVAVGEGGALELAFEGGARLVALGSEHNVGWHVQLDDGASAASLAEGRIVWQ